MAQPATENNQAPQLNVNEDVPVPAEEASPPIEEIVTREVVERIVKNTDADLELMDFAARPGTDAGDGYMSIMYAVDIEVKSSKTGEKKTLNIMLKTMPRHSLRQQMINEMKAFVKESKMYDEIFPAFLKYQKDHGLKDEELFQKFPKCHATFCDGKTDYLAMEDLRPEGYKMGNRHKGLDFAHCSMVVKNMAKFHAISFALFKGDYHAIKAVYPYLEEKMMMPADQLPDMMKSYWKQSMVKEGEIVREGGFEYEARIIESIARDELFDELYRLVGCPVKNAVIGHGDCWTNNFLFKYDEITREPIDFKFLDFQLARPSSRTIDFGYFLHTSPQLSIMNDRWEELLQIYHDEFTCSAKKLGFEDKGLTYDKLVEEVAQFRLFGVVMGLMLTPVVSAQKEDVPDMESMPTEFTTEDMDAFMGNMLKSDIVLRKLVNLAKHHAVKIPFITEYVKNNP